MISLKKLLSGLRYKIVMGSISNDVKAICTNTKDMQYQSVFVCIKGSKTDSHYLIAQAVYKGAAAVICEEDMIGKISLPNETAGVTVISVPNTRYALSHMAAVFYNRPSDHMIMIGITGTKGKTTVSYMIEKILNEAGIKAGLIGSIEKRYDGRSFASENTTPDALTIWQTLADMEKCGVKAVVIEVSSQGLKMDRVSSIIFDYAVFTNFSRDHIGANEHRDMEEYLSCKAKLFTMCRKGIFNADDEYLEQIIKISGIKDVAFYGIDDGPGAPGFYLANHINTVITKDSFSMAFNINMPHDGKNEKTISVSIPIPGIFSVYNALAAVAVCDIMSGAGLCCFTDGSITRTSMLDSCKKALSNIDVEGRLQMFTTSCGSKVIVDYAHNEVSLKNLLVTMKEYINGRIITLFGCGGERSVERRYKMGEAASHYSDIVVITSDNPRNEDPQAIMADIESGMDRADLEYYKIEDRKEAVRFAMSIAKEGDMVIIAGKGHEKYQEIGGIRYYMNDAEIVKSLLA